MKFMTTNFVKCSIKSCDSSSASFPLKYQNCTLVQEEQEFNPEFIVSILDRLEWDGILKVAKDLGNTSLPSSKPENIDLESEESLPLLQDLHSLLLETNITEGEMICNNCEHIYYIKNSIPNFLLPPHLA